jgi:hypothetical protein
MSSSCEQMCETSANEVEIVEDCSLINDAETPSTNKLGRPKSAVWVHFKEGEYDQKKKRRSAECLHCSDVLEGKPEKLEQHILETCKRVPDTVRKDFRKALRQSIPQGAETPSLTRADVKRLAKTKRKSGNEDLTEYMWRKDRVSSSEKQRADQAMLLFFIMCGISFRTANSPYFLGFVRELNPHFEPPGMPVKNFNNVRTAPSRLPKCVW